MVNGMTRKIFHRGYVIVANSYCNDRGEWVPRASLKPKDDELNREEMPLHWNHTFTTRLEADDFALEAAELYLDEDR